MLQSKPKMAALEFDPDMALGLGIGCYSSYTCQLYVDAWR